MLKNTANFMLFVLLGAVLFVTSCKKDPFSEKDALQAQKELLAQKFGYDLAIANVSLQIQRAGDSARIAIQNLSNKGESDLEKEKLAASLALKLADFNNLLTSLRYQDSLSRINAYVNSVGGVRSYQIRVIDEVTSAPVNGATVKVLPWGAANFVSVKTNSDGIAIMTNVIIDPSAIFYAMDETAGITSVTTMTRRLDLDNNPTIGIYRTSATTTQRVAGVCYAKTDLTTAAAGTVGAGVTVRFTATKNGATTSGSSIATPSTSFLVSGITDATGAYSVSVPRGLSWTVTGTSISLMQKMFVNHLEGIDNPFTSVTRIDSQLVSFSHNPTTARTAPAVWGYYLNLPADSLTGANVRLREFAGSSTTIFTNSSNARFMSGLLNKVTRGIRSADGNSIDTLGTFYTQPISDFQVNNNWLSLAQSHNYKVRLDDAGVRVPDTLAVEVVSLVPNPYVTSYPEFVAITNADGSLNRIEPKKIVGSSLLVNGGRFVLNATAASTYSVTSGGVTTSYPTGTGYWLSNVVLPTFANRNNYTHTGSIAGLTLSKTTTLTTSFDIYYGVSTSYVGR